MAAKAYLMVRAVLAEAADRPRFDRWYETEHLPEAVAGFRAQRGWRCWSQTNPVVHYAFYELADLARAQAALDRPNSRPWWRNSTRVWDSRVTRSREVLEVAGVLRPGPG